MLGEEALSAFIKFNQVVHRVCNDGAIITVANRGDVNGALAGADRRVAGALCSQFVATDLSVFGVELVHDEDKEKRGKGAALFDGTVHFNGVRHAVWCAVFHAEGGSR